MAIVETNSVGTGVETTNGRLRFIDERASQGSEPICEAVHNGLTAKPKTVPSRFFYDQAGSELFERITQLPEYYLTRCEADILSTHAPEIVEATGRQISIAEFGSGSSSKTRLLIQTALEVQPELTYLPVDISREFLRSSSNSLLSDYDRLKVTAIAAEYSQALDLFPAHSEPRLILFLGSNIGNFTRLEAQTFLANVARTMGKDDRLLVGVDLVKDRKVIEAAYNDAQGVTAEFNRNLLRRINRDLCAHFDPEMFRHRAPYDEVHHRIEMQLISTGEQHISVEDLESTYDFEDQEILITEWSHKYSRESFASLASQARLEISHEWMDPKNWFAEFLLRKA